MSNKQDNPTITTSLKLVCRQVPSLELLVPSVEVTYFGERLIELCKSMYHVMEEDAGIGLAAPQVGYNVKLVILDSKASLLSADTRLEKAKFSGKGQEFYILVNPAIIYYSTEQVDLWNGEGCLSLLDAKLGKVMRSKSIKLRYQNVKGELIEEDFSGRLATVIQHEVDHLYGILYPARMKESERNALMVDYLRRKRLNQLDLVRFNEFMQLNLTQYTRNLANTATIASYSINDLREFSIRLGMGEASLESVVSSINYLNRLP